MKSNKNTKSLNLYSLGAITWPTHIERGHATVVIL